MECNCERNCVDVNLEALLPTAKISSSSIKVLMISEALPKNLNDYFYTTEQAAFFKTTCQALDDAGYHIKSINYIFKRKYGSNVIQSGSTYKIRKETYILNGIRFFPSYTQTGDSFNIEKSKRIMIAEDIRNAFEYAGIVKYK